MHVTHTRTHIRNHIGAKDTHTLKMHIGVCVWQSKVRGKSGGGGPENLESLLEKLSVQKQLLAGKIKEHCNNNSNNNIRFVSIFCCSV